MTHTNFHMDETVVNLIVKTAGSLCNIACTYCFEQVKDVDINCLTAENLKKAIDKIQGKCTLVFHGGEPLIVGKDRFRQYLDIVRKYYGTKILVVRVQTNGTLLDLEWLEMLFNEYHDLNIEIAISLDGTERMNQYRIDHKGMPTYHKILNGFELLKQHNKKAGMLSVISKDSLQYFKEYIDLIEKISNISFVKINALFNVVNNELTHNSITPIEYSKFIINVGNEYIKRELYKKIALEPILSILQRLNNKDSRYCNYSSRKCFNYISLYPDGSIGPCDCLSVNEFYIGNIKNDSSINEQTMQYLNESKESILVELLNKCKVCEIESFCKGGCLSQRYYFNENKLLREEFCESKKMLFSAFSKYRY